MMAKGPRPRLYIKQSQILTGLRKEHGYLQKEVSELTGLAPTVYGDLERGQRHMGLQSAEALADLYGVTLDFITGRSQSRSTVGAKTTEDEITINSYMQLNDTQRYAVQRFIARLRTAGEHEI